MTKDRDNSESDEVLTVDEVAALLKTTAPALYSQRHRGQRPGALALQIGPGNRGRIGFMRSDIRQYLVDQAAERDRELEARHSVR